MNFSNSFNTFIFRILFLYHRYKYFIQTKLELFFLSLRGIDIGKNVKFRGYAKFYRYPNTSIKIGNNCVFNSDEPTNHIGMNHKCIISAISPGSQILIGNNVGISSSSISSFTSIYIGNNVRIGANCIIMDGDFHLDDPRSGQPKPVRIEENVWIGANVTVMKGVTIGKNTIIGINSLVNSSIPSNVVACGNPCKVVKQLSQSVIDQLNF